MSTNCLNFRQNGNVSMLLTLAVAASVASAPASACPPIPSVWADESQPYHVAVAPSGRVYATNPYTNQVNVHAANGALIGTWGSLGGGHGQLNTPTGIAVDVSGKVYVADTQNSRIEVFDADGGYLSTIQHPGVGEGQFLAPLDISIGPANDLFVVNQWPGANKIVRYGLSGAFLAEWPVTIVNTAYDIAADSDGRVYGMQITEQGMVEVFNSTGGSLGAWSPALPGETVYLGGLEAHGGVVCVSLMSGADILLRTFDGSGAVQCPGIAAPGLGALATDAANNTYIGDLQGGKLYSTRDLKVATRGQTWGQLKVRFR